MSPRRGESRDRMVLSAAALLREYGASATSSDRVLADSGAPRGSVYHHFPGGRAQLIDEAVTPAGDFVAGLIDAAMQADAPVDAVDAFFVLWRDRLVESDFRAGCPIVAVAVETNGDAPQPARSAAAVFARWQEALASLFLRHGLTEERSRRLGGFVIAAVEGAVIMCRAEQSRALPRSEQPPPRSTTCSSMPCATAPERNHSPGRSPQSLRPVSSPRRSRHAHARPSRQRLRPRPRRR